MFAKTLARTFSNSAAHSQGKISIYWMGSGLFGGWYRDLLLDTPEWTSRFEIAGMIDESNASDYQSKVLDNPNINSVYLCTPDIMHDSQAIQCMKTGKNIFSEKPVYNFQSVWDQALQSNKIMQVGFNRRFDSRFAQAKALCAEKRPKKIRICSWDPIDTKMDGLKNMDH